MNEVTTADTILEKVKGIVASGRMLNPELWAQTAFRLNVLLGDETNLLEDLRMEVARKKLEIMRRQDKRNVAAAETEVEATELYSRMKKQEHKVAQIEEFIRLAKKNSSQNF